MSALKTRFAAAAARRLRASMSEAERKLWSRLRDRRLRGFKFVRQQPIGRYIADFACGEADLVAELDGGQHADDAAASYDQLRTEAIAEHGYKVIRFWNNDVMGNMDCVLTAITAELEKAPSPGLRFARPDLSPEGEVVQADAMGSRP
ncbi:MAG TPA: endonuclease domain-containing protein [Devosiaceae bacterium]|jgi:very-short-patch-repair endonuclease|nr:endonuclease domain-containing protein [Devosiaceae bacterium]